MNITSYMATEGEIEQASLDLEAALGADDIVGAVTKFINQYDRCQSSEVQVMLAMAMECQFDSMLEQEKFEHAVGLCEYMFTYFSDQVPGAHSSGAHHAGRVFSDKDQVPIHRACSMVLYQTCDIFGGQGQLDQEMEYYQRHVDLYRTHTDVEIKQQNAECFFFLGISYGQQKEHDKAMQVYEAMLLHHDASDDPDIRELCAKARINIAGVHSDLGRPAKAIETYHQLIDSAPAELPDCLYDPVSMAYVSLVDDYLALGEIDKCRAMASAAMPLLDAHVVAILDEQREKKLVLQFMQWCIDDQRHELRPVLTAIEEYEAATADDWYINWDLAGVNAQLSKMNTEKQRQAKLILSHLLGKVSAQEVLDAIPST